MPSHDPSDTALPHANEESERVHLARVALAAALAAPGVVRGDSGPLRIHRTPVPDSEPLIGVVCAATADGGYDVGLRLVATLVPLPALAETVAKRVRVSARATGLGEALQNLSIHFADIEYGSPAA